MIWRFGVREDLPDAGIETEQPRGSVELLEHRVEDAAACFHNTPGNVDQPSSTWRRRIPKRPQANAWLPVRKSRTGGSRESLVRRGFLAADRIGIGECVSGSHRPRGPMPISNLCALSRNVRHDRDEWGERVRAVCNPTPNSAHSVAALGAVAARAKWSGGPPPVA